MRGHGSWGHGYVVAMSPGAPQSAVGSPHCGVTIGDVRFGPKVGQISHKLDKSGTFSDQISVHFGSVSQNVLTLILKSHTIIVPFGANLTHFGSKSGHLDLRDTPA